MRLLFDFKTPQSFVGGASEYIRKVFYTLLDYINAHNEQTTIVGLIDSSINHVAYPDLEPKALEEKGVRVVDIAETNLREVVKQQQIDRIFIGCGQTWKMYNLSGIQCPVICVIHDLWNEEFECNYLMEYLQLNNFSSLKYNLHRLKMMFHKGQAIEGVGMLMKALGENSKAHVVTVSNYSKNSIIFNYGFPEDRISVLYAPSRISVKEVAVINADLKELIEEKKKYYLMVSTDRVTKNADKAIRAFNRYLQYSKDDAFLVTVGYKKARVFEHQIILPYLSESDLAYAYENCYAFIYPSLMEGFGYPPVEAMAAGKPVLCANVTSIPEIVGEAAVQFSPFYESDIFRALLTLNDANYQHIQRKSKDRFAHVNEKQETDLKTLVEMLTIA